MNKLPILFFFLCLTISAPAFCSTQDNYIFCSDMSGDIDDLGAMTVLLHEHKLGRINLLASVLSVREGQGYRIMRQMANWYSNFSLRIGVNKSTYGMEHKDDHWVNQYLAQYQQQPFPTEDATDLIIEILNSYPDVIIVVVGPQTNLANVERISPGTLQKAKKIAVMAGKFTMGKEYNIFNDIESAALVQPFVDEYYGYELGYIITGEDSIFKDNTPVRFGYSIYTGGVGRESWDLIAAIGSQKGENWFTYTTGTNTIFPDGSNSFLPSSDGVNTYAKYKTGKDIELKNYLNSIIGINAKSIGYKNNSQAATNFLLLRKP